MLTASVRVLWQHFSVEFNISSYKWEPHLSCKNKNTVATKPAGIVTVFHTKLICVSNSLIFYTDELLLQKPMYSAFIILKSGWWTVIGPYENLFCFQKILEIMFVQLFEKNWIGMSTLKKFSEPGVPRIVWHFLSDCKSSYFKL